MHKLRILITSDKDLLDEIRKDLKISGITETTLFPDLEGLISGNSRRV